MAGDDFLDSVRLKQQERDALLSKLDEHRAMPTKGETRREHERIEYRASDISVRIEHPGGGFGRFLVCARNLSRGGMSFVHGGFLHQGTECEIRLVTLSGKPKILRGNVRSCRHLARHLHEVGIQFREKIDPGDFCSPRAIAQAASESSAPEESVALPELHAQVLYLGASTVEQKLIGHRLSGAGLVPIIVDSTGAALDQIKRLPIDLILCELECGEHPVDQLRQAGFQGPIVGLLPEHAAAIDGDPSVGPARGTNSVLIKPYDTNALLQHIAAHLTSRDVKRREEGLTSSLTDERGAEEIIRFFANEASRSATALEQALAEENLSELSRVAQTLRSLAAGYGFAPISEASRQVLDSLRASEALAQSKQQVQLLIKLCRKIQSDSAGRTGG